MGRLIYFNQFTDCNSAIDLAISDWLNLKTFNTKKNYKRAVERFKAFLLAENKNIKNISSQDLAKYIHQRQQEQGKTPRYAGDSLTASATIEMEIGAIKALYRTLYDLKLIERNPICYFKIEIKEKTKRVTEALSDADIVRLINAPDATTKKGLRDKVILCLLFGAGLRRSECLNLRIGDIKRTHEGKIYLSLRNTKKGKEEEQALAEFAQLPVRDYLKIRNFEGAGTNDPYIVGYGYHDEVLENGISDSTLYRGVVKYAKSIGCSNITPHSLRATVCTKLLKDGNLDLDVMDFTRHTNVQMLNLYYKRSKKIKDSVINKLVI